MNISATTKTILLSLLLTTSVYTHSFAQPVILHPNDYQDYNLWLNNCNPTGILFNPSKRLSTAEIGYQFTQGNLRLTHEGSSIHRYNIYSESYTFLKNIKLYGRISYSNNQQNGRQWATTIQPEKHLVNFGDTVVGRQATESYRITGAIAFPLHRNWSAGGKINYTAHSNIKNKDPRNKNDQTDLTCIPGLLYHRQLVQIGVNFIYQRTIETVAYSTLNSDQKDARSFYPLWFYINENFQLGSNNLRTYDNNDYGGALQFSFDCSNWKWLNEFQYIQGKELCYTRLSEQKGETERKEFIYNGQIRIQRNSQHTFSPSFRHQVQTGFDNLQGKADHSNQQNVEDYGKVKRSAIIGNYASLNYHLLNYGDSLKSRRRIKARVDYTHEKTFYFAYPSCFSQSTECIEFSGEYSQLIRFQRQSIEFKTELGYSQGWGNMLKMATIEGLSAPELGIQQEETPLQQNYQVKIAKILKYSLEIEYIRHLNTSYALFSKATIGHHQGVSNIWGSKQDRLFCGLSAGVLF